MRSPASSADPGSGQHGLGPHVVGQRVVVRRLLPGETGPSGGPAMTDLLGVCTDWSDGWCVVRPETGDPVRIRLADIVSGKPVPPRPSVRHRVSVQAAERHGLVLWPGIEHIALGEWVLRCDRAPTGRLYKRANSALAIGDPGVPLDEALTTTRDFYATREREALLQVQTESEIEEAGIAAGWRPLPHGEADFMMASIASVRRARRRAGLPASPGRDPGSGAPPEGDDPVRVSAEGPRALARWGRPDQPSATGRAALDSEWLCLYDVHVTTDQRRRGLAGRLVDALLEWGAEQGATTAWLHVETDNEAATALYERFGFTRHHTCRYLSAPDRP